MYTILAYPAFGVLKRPVAPGLSVYNRLPAHRRRHRRFRLLLAGLLATLLIACSTAPSQLGLVCDDQQTLCYRGNSIDNQATRDRYGVLGLIRLNNEYGDRSR